MSEPVLSGPAMPTFDAASFDTAAIQAEVDAHSRGRVPRELRWRQVIAYAHELFVERGYAAASMDELAERVGVSKPVIYDLSGSKEELFSACMQIEADELYRRVAEAVASSDDPGERLAAGIRAWLQFIDERRAAWTALLGSLDTPVTEAVASIRRRQTEFVAETLTHDARASGIEVDETMVGAVATTVTGGLEAAAAWWADHPEVSVEVLAAVQTQLIRTGLDSFW